jgi:DUF1680 family protein
MADLARLLGDRDLLKACGEIWNNIVKRQMYITGGIGQSAFGEAFSYDYDLPNDLVYAVTCASIGLAFFAHRMLSIAPRAEYGDVLERTLFNGILSGMALDGKSFFYVNPLEVIPEASEKLQTHCHAKIRRQKWFGCSCCPPNLARIFSSLGGYIHSSREDALFTHLYIGSEASLRLNGKEVGVKIETGYPWKGEVSVRFSAPEGAAFRYGIRIPQWCESFSLLLNGEKAGYALEEGYAVISREWRDGDILVLDLRMPAVLVEANPRVRENRGKAALMRGPLVYCLEETDNGPELFNLRLGTPGDITVTHEKDLLQGVTVLSCTGKREKDWDNDDLYREAGEPILEDRELRFIPYYAWANREPGEMAVWLRR